MLYAVFEGSCNETVVYLEEGTSWSCLGHVSAPGSSTLVSPDYVACYKLTDNDTLTEINAAVSPRSTSVNLTFSSIQMSDNGTYICRASCCQGNDVSLHTIDIIVTGEITGYFAEFAIIWCNMKVSISCCNVVGIFLVKSFICLIRCLE